MQITITPESLELFRKVLREEIRAALKDLALNSKRENTIDRPLTIDAAADFLSMSKSTIYKLVCYSAIPHNKRGRRLYFNQHELAEWVNKGRRKTKEESEAATDAFLSRKGGWL